MELIVSMLLVAMLGPAALRWGEDSTPAMPDGHRQQGL
jgi:hypothetical protein